MKHLIGHRGSLLLLFFSDIEILSNVGDTTCNMIFFLPDYYHAVNVQGIFHAISVLCLKRNEVDMMFSMKSETSENPTRTHKHTYSAYVRKPFVIYIY